MFKWTNTNSRWIQPIIRRGIMGSHLDLLALGWLAQSRRSRPSMWTILNILKAVQIIVIQLWAVVQMCCLENLLSSLVWASRRQRFSSTRSRAGKIEAAQHHNRTSLEGKEERKERNSRILYSRDPTRKMVGQINFRRLFKKTDGRNITSVGLYWLCVWRDFEAKTGQPGVR
jgi:hypothetical protein